ncbi:MAG TPA: hypothetical protein VGK16_02670 [Candidatus Limnocylindrales bacterium]
MADETPTGAEAVEVEANPIEDLIEQAEALLHLPAAGYDAAHEAFDNGVKAVIDLLRAAL